MTVERFLRRIRRGNSPSSIVEVSITLAVALLLVMTGLRLLGGFDVDLHRASAQSSIAADAGTMGRPAARPTN